MARNLRGTKSEQLLALAFARACQANRRYLYFAKLAEIEGHQEVAALFREVAEAVTDHACGHVDFLREVGDPVTAMPFGDIQQSLQAAVAGEIYEYTARYPAFAKVARDEGLEVLADGLRHWRGPTAPGPIAS